MKHDYLHVKQTACRAVFLQGCHVFKSCRSTWKPVANPKNGNRFKTSPNRTFSNKKKSISSLQHIDLHACLRKSEDYFKTEYGEARASKWKEGHVKKYHCLIVILGKSSAKSELPQEVTG